MVKAKKWILAKEFVGEVKDSNFRLEEEELPAPKTGEFICEAVYWSVDPYMRAYKFPAGNVVIGEQVARVTESKNKDYPVGSLVQLYSGWRTHTLVTPTDMKTDPMQFTSYKVQKVPDLGGRSPSLALGVMGMPGMSAYFGFLDLCQPKKGDVVVVNAAAGAVGSLVGQIAKIKGCKVIGFAGSKDKCDWLKTLGFDYAFNYKKDDIDKALTTAAPDGVDCYFDNVGGNFSSNVINRMKMYGRISVCGQISLYNATELTKVPDILPTILGKQLKVEGFVTIRWFARYPEGRKEMLKWISEGKIKFQETLSEGFGNMPKAFVSLFSGANTGKVIVKA